MVEIQQPHPAHQLPAVPDPGLEAVAAGKLLEAALDEGALGLRRGLPRPGQKGAEVLAVARHQLEQFLGVAPLVEAEPQLVVDLQCEKGQGTPPQPTGCRKPAE